MLVAFGGLIASGGGFVTLGLIGAVVTGQVPERDLGAVALGWTVLGLLPLLAGGLMFGLGIRSLNSK